MVVQIIIRHSAVVRSSTGSAVLTNQQQIPFYNNKILYMIYRRLCFR